MGLMNQQAISLLVLGSFSSTGTGGTNPVNAAAIMSSTLSNMLSQISNDFNIGINYIPGDRVSNEQLEVALSTQLLDDRLIIDGNIDVSSNSSSTQKTSSIVGDINVEYKLTPDGRFRVKAFNRSNDLSLFEDESPYTQGVGVFYRKEFDNIGELFRKSKVRAGKKINK
jgi:predicted acyl esterase